MDQTQKQLPQFDSTQKSTPLIQDIFAQVDNPNAPVSQTEYSIPDIRTIPVAPRATELSARRGFFSRVSIFQNRWIWIIGMIMILLISVAAAIFILSKDTAGTATKTNQNANINSSQPIQSIHIQSVNLNQNVVVVDTDGDGLTDSEEASLKTDIRLIDSDQDGLTDREEVRVYATNPINEDTDGDHYSDGEEVAKMYNPKGPGKLFDIKTEITKAESNSNQ